MRETTLPSPWSDTAFGLNKGTIIAIASIFALYGVVVIWRCKTEGNLVLFLYTAAVVDFFCGIVHQNVIDISMTAFIIVFGGVELLQMMIGSRYPVVRMRLLAIACAHVIISFVLADLNPSLYFSLEYVGMSRANEPAQGDLFHFYCMGLLTLLGGSFIFSLGVLMSRTTFVVTFSSYYLVSAAISFGALGDGTLEKYYSVIGDVVHMDVDLLHKFEERYFLALLCGWLFVVLLVLWRMFHKLAIKRREFYDVLFKQSRKEDQKIKGKLLAWKEKAGAKVTKNMPPVVQKRLTAVVATQKARQIKKSQTYDAMFASLDKRAMKNPDFEAERAGMFERTKSYYNTRKTLGATGSGQPLHLDRDVDGAATRTGGQEAAPSGRKSRLRRKTAKDAVPVDVDDETLRNHLDKFAKLGNVTIGETSAESGDVTESAEDVPISTDLPMAAVIEEASPMADVIEEDESSKSLAEWMQHIEKVPSPSAPSAPSAPAAPAAAPPSAAPSPSAASPQGSAPVRQRTSDYGPATLPSAQPSVGGAPPESDEEI